MNSISHAGKTGRTILLRFPSFHQNLIVWESVLIVEGQQHDMVAFFAACHHLLNVQLLVGFRGIHGQGSGILVAQGYHELDFRHWVTVGWRQIGGADTEHTRCGLREDTFAVRGVFVHHDFIIQKSCGAIGECLLSEANAINVQAKKGAEEQF